MTDTQAQKPDTGLQAWAREHGTSADEVAILLQSENADPEKILGGSLDSPEPIPAGRSDALQAMVARGRRGDITAPLQVIAKITGRSVDEILDAVHAGTGTGRYVGCLTDAHPDYTEGAVKSSVLHDLLSDLAGNHAGPNDAPPDDDQILEMIQDGPSVPPAVGSPGQGTQAPDSGPEPARPEKPAPKRRTKYSLTKSAAMDLFRPVTDGLPIRDVRAFLLSMPGHKPQDVALMSDQEAAGAISAGYVCVPMPGGTLVFPSHVYGKLAGFLASNEIYYVPSAGTKEESK